MGLLAQVHCKGGSMIVDMCIAMSPYAVMFVILIVTALEDR
jgi:hypothetical protein